jgi:ABC-type molybdenum transport system ATPase subunit/photorepair protein PhrA
MRGELWALKGENGAGKSTLLSLICALTILNPMLAILPYLVENVAAGKVSGK